MLIDTLQVKPVLAGSLNNCSCKHRALANEAVFMLMKHYRHSFGKDLSQQIELRCSFYQLHTFFFVVLGLSTFKFALVSVYFLNQSLIRLIYRNSSYKNENDENALNQIKKVCEDFLYPGGFGVVKHASICETVN